MNTIEPTPEFAPMPRWCAISGMGRTRTYEELAAGNLSGVKLGTRLLINVPKGLAWLRSLPQPVISVRRKAA